MPQEIGRVKIQELKIQVLEESIKNLSFFMEQLKGGAFHHKSNARMGFTPNMLFKCENGIYLGCQLANANLYGLQEPRYLLEHLNGHLHDADDENPQWVYAEMSKDEEYFVFYYNFQ